MFFVPPPPPPPQPIIVWVHGTRGSSFIPWATVNETVQARIDALTRTPKGLHSLTALNPESKPLKMLTALSDTDPQQFPRAAIYAFGWSGKLDGLARKKASKRLYAALGALTAEYKQQYGVAPPLILMSHSHGGNVILHMAPLSAQRQPITILKTILLACPVQQDTAAWVSNPFFGIVYSFHSHVDLMQIMDPQRLQPYKEALQQAQNSKSLTPLKQAYLLSLEQPLFSERHFPTSSNLLQVNLCWDGLTTPPPQQKWLERLSKILRYLAIKKRGILHSEFVTPEFMGHLPNILIKLDEHIAKGILSNHDIEMQI